MTYDEAFEILLKDGTIYEPPYDAVFDFVDAVMKRKTTIAFDLLNQAYEGGEATMVLLSVLYSNAKAVLQVQACQSKDIARVTGLTGWQIKHALEQKGHYSIQELVSMLKLIHKCEKGIKTGQIDEQFVLEYILVNCL